MSQQQLKYRIAILANSDKLAMEIAAAIIDECCAVVYTTSVHELYRIVAIKSVNLIIIATSRYRTTDYSFYNSVELLYQTGIDIFVITTHRSVRHTIRLLHLGVRQCITMPIAVSSLRRKIYEHLSTKCRHPYIVS